MGLKLCLLQNLQTIPPSHTTITTWTTLPFSNQSPPPPRNILYSDRSASWPLRALDDQAPPTIKGVAPNTAMVIEGTEIDMTLEACDVTTCPRQECNRNTAMLVKWLHKLDIWCEPISTSDINKWPTFKSKWWTKITWGFIPPIQSIIETCRSEWIWGIRSKN